MTQAFSAGLITQGGSGEYQVDNLIATIPSNGTLTKVDLEGVLSVSSTSFTYAAGNFITLNHMAGIQWVPHGDSPFPLTASPILTGFWLTLNNGFSIPSTRTQGQSSTTYIASDLIGVSERWRGLFTPGEEIDLYWSWGENESLGDIVVRRGFVAYNAVWATYP